MQVKFDPVVKVMEMDVTKAEHAAEVRNPKNMIQVVPHELLMNDSHTPETPIKQTDRMIIWILVIILIITIIIMSVRRKNKMPIIPVNRSK